MLNCCSIINLAQVKSVSVGVENSDARKVRKYERKVGRNGLERLASALIFTVGFFLRRRGLRVDNNNNNKFSLPFLQVTFEMSQMLPSPPLPTFPL